MSSLKFSLAPVSCLLVLLPLTRVCAVSCPPVYVHDGEHDGDYLGGAVVGVGDVDGDGCEEYATGAAGFDTPQQQGIGKVYLYSGATGEIMRTWLGLIIDPAAWGGAFGSRLARAGDMDGDGVPDLIVAAPTFKGPAGWMSGRADVYSGSTGGLIRRWYGEEQYRGFGHAIAGTGDADGDDVPDVIVGEWPPANPGEFRGRVQVLSGATGARLWQLTGPEVRSGLGYSVDFAGDFNGDGYDDVVAGLAGGQNYPKRVWVLSGPDGTLLWEGYGTYSIDGFGHSVAGAGDVDGDGHGDIIVGAHYHAYDQGRVYVFGGPDGHFIHGWDGAHWWYFGSAVAGVGDVNGDGVPDIGVGEHGAGDTAYAAGKVYVFSGATGALVAAWPGVAALDVLGLHVGWADVDGDGRPEILSGAEHDDGSSIDKGRAYVFRAVWPGDCNCDGGSDLNDQPQLAACMADAESRGYVPTGCHCLDFNADERIDLRDAAELSRRTSALSGCCNAVPRPVCHEPACYEHQGCEVPACQDAVCAIDSYCCEVH